MNASTSNLEQLRRDVFGRFPGVQAISFDVFDTLVQRTLPHPDLTKVPAAAALKALLSDHEEDAEVGKLHDLRLRIESELRAKARAEGHDPECRIGEVFSEWVRRSGLDPSKEQVDALVSAELDGEFAVVFATAGMVDFVRELRERGIRLFYVSDTYLNPQMIEDILERCGYHGLFDEGYLSSESLLAKYSGRLFRHILEDQKLGPDELLHIGDRDHADVRGAGRASVSALRFRDDRMRRRHACQSYLASLGRRNPFWEGARWTGRNIAAREHSRRCGSDPRYNIAYEYLGPLLCNFIHRVLNRIGNDSVDLVLFNSREGFVLQELYSRIAGAFPERPFPPSRYAYLTRKSVYPASLLEVGRREIDMGFHTTSPSLRNLFIRFSLPVQELEEPARKAGFTDLDEFIEDPLNSAALKRLIADPRFARAVRNTRDHAAALLFDYLDQIEFWEAGKVAVVDVGWSATTQDALAVAVSDRPRRPSISGYYLALLGVKRFEAVPGSEMLGLFHDYRESDGGSPLGRFVELFETACRAPHPTVVGFEREATTGRVVPAFKSRETLDARQEAADRALISSLQSGIFDYCDDYVRTLNFHDTGPEADSAYILYRIDRLLRYPTKEEAELLSGFAHSEDFGQSLVHVADQRSDEVSAYVQAHGLRRRRPLWREGSMACMPLPGLNVLLNFYRVLKTARY